MTGIPENDLIAPASAADVDARAMDFILKRHLDDWSAQDRAEFESWLAQSFAHKAAYWRLQSVWSRADRLSALRPLSPNRPAPKTAPRRGALLKIAATVVLLAGAGAAAVAFMSNPAAKTYETALGERKNITLADGSRIELNTDTVIRADVNESRRTIELVRGEALFQVHHDAARPFTVLASHHRITDLGTTFVVREKPGRLEVALLEGQARLESESAKARSQQVAVLMPGDEAVATPQRISVTRKPVAGIRDDLGWRRGVLVFHRTSLSEVAAEYNRYNERKIVIADRSAAARTMSATLPVNDLDTFARIARNFLGLRVRESKDEIVISN
ncbi:MAG TPA: FecR domain-containing protein [Rhizomicrobium sp.]|nr:FecR domain-containing protein [Rhizomicrobium sp.]